MQFVVVMGNSGGVSPGVPEQALALAENFIATIKDLANQSVKFIQEEMLCKIQIGSGVICNEKAAISVFVIFISIALGIICYIFTKFCFCVRRSHRRRKRRNRLKKMEEQEQLQAEMLQQQMQNMQMQGQQMRQQLAYQSQMQQAQMQQALMQQALMQQAQMQQAQMQQEQMQQEQMRQEQMRQEQMRQEQMRQAQIHRQDINGYSEASLSHEHSHSEDNFIGLGYQSTP
ncbi:hypothetical protein PVP01_0901200 [Plasmodium vivax]|uniref:Uncharacterized protein n=1 Tax=Plasmodium vivax TaxID=5855 RepID=A0A564ZU68_PLAVI|nr:hypothetical protein PVP01_0901200 [Plasmodium vivax]